MRMMRILLVEDEINIAVSLSRALQQGLKSEVWVETSLSSEGAIYALRAKVFDLLIADHNLPGMTGLELIEKARQLHPQLKSILISGGPRDQLEALAASKSVLFIAKPFQVTKFISQIHELFNLGNSDTIK